MLIKEDNSTCESDTDDDDSDVFENKLNTGDKNISTSVNITFIINTCTTTNNNN